MFIKKTCPQCGNTIDFDDSRAFMFCHACGAKVEHTPSADDAAPAQPQAPVAQPQAPAAQPQASAQPQQTNAASNHNLHIYFSSINPAIGMVVRFVPSNQTIYFLTGQQYSAQVPAGILQLMFRIGNREYPRTIYLRDDNAPVTIYASWDGRSHITIDQPPYAQGVPVQPTPVYYAAPSPMPIPGGKFCPACGKQLDADAAFCTQCGKRL